MANLDIRSILFDLDGTLTDPKVGITTCIRHAMDSLALGTTEQSLNWCIGPPLVDSFAVLFDSQDPLLLNEALLLYRERFSSIGLYENELYPDVAEGLAQLTNAGYQLYLATSKPHIYARRILEHFEIDQYFIAIHGSELSGARTDKAELIAYIVEQAQLDPQHCVMIGDRQFDIIGAKQNSICSIGVSYGYGSLAELKQAQPDYLFAEFNDLIDFLLQDVLPN